MPVIAMGQITITDMHDAVPLSAVISASQNTTQMYDNTKQTYNPNYATTPQVLTLILTKAGSPTSLIGANIGNITWEIKEGASRRTVTSTTTTDTEYKSGTKHSVLTLKTNTNKDSYARRITASGVYTDPASGLETAFNASIDLTVVQLANAAVIANVYAPNGDFFRNGTPASLIINADLYKDGAISNGSKITKWFAADSSVTTSQDVDGGIGWRKITATTGTTGAVASTTFGTATTTASTLTVYPDAVTNGQTFMVVMEDRVGGTSGTKVRGYITLRDMDDPIALVVDSSGGNILKNGQGSTTLKARLFQNGEEIDTGGTIYNYKWYKWQDNDMVANFGGTGIAFKSGQTLNVGASDVNKVTTFKIEVETK